MNLRTTIAVILLSVAFVSAQVLLYNSPEEIGVIFPSRNNDEEVPNSIPQNDQKRRLGLLLAGLLPKPEILQPSDIYHRSFKDRVLDKAEVLNALPDLSRTRRCSRSGGNGSGGAKSLAGLATGAGGSLNFVGGVIGYLFGLRNVQAGAGLGLGLGAEGRGGAEGGTAECF